MAVKRASSSNSDVSLCFSINPVLNQNKSTEFNLQEKCEPLQWSAGLSLGIKLIATNVDIHGHIATALFACFLFASSAFTLLAGRQEGNPACRQSECLYAGGGDLTGARRF